MKKLLSNIFWYPSSSKERIERYQKKIRDLEWDVIKLKIPINSSFLDVGCGAGDNMLRAINELDCKCEGIDPDPGSHGVGRYYGLNTSDKLSIVKGVAENLPYPDNTFDVVFCSHVLEHVNDEQQSLKEMKRVLKPDGLLIIGMPTATVAALTWLSSIVFTTHIAVLFAIKSIRKPDFLYRLRIIFIPDSHSKPKATTILYDLRHYQTTNWKRIISSEFKIKSTFYPALYPMPDFPWFFPAIKLKFTGCSVFFTAKPK